MVVRRSLAVVDGRYLKRTLADSLGLLDDMTVRVARSACVTMLVVAVTAVVPVPASGALPSGGKGTGDDVVGDRLLGERIKNLHDPMVTWQGAPGDPSMSTVTGADGIGCWSQRKDDGSTERTCSELMLHTVTV